MRVRSAPDTQRNRGPEALSRNKFGMTKKGDRVLQLQTDAGARYERFDAVLVTIKRGGITRLGFVGNERCGRW